MPGSVSTGALSALIDSRSWSDVLDRLRTHPKEASIKIHKGGDESLPLHEACKNQPTEEVVAALISEHRPALYHRGQFGYIPLHFAIKCEAKLAVVTCLIEEYPYGSRTKDDSGKLPLHLACQYGAPPDIVNLLLMNHPQAIIMADNTNKRPMDYAMTSKCHNPGNEGDLVRVLERAPWYCKVSKAATLRASDEFDAKMTLAERGHYKEIERQQQQFEKESQKYRDEVKKLKDDLKRERERNAGIEGKLRTGLEEMTSKAEGLTKELAEQKSKAKEERESANIAYKKLSDECDNERERANGLTEALHGCEEVLAEREIREKDLIEDVKKLEATVETMTSESEELWADLEKEREHANDLADALQGCQMALADREKKHAVAESEFMAKLKVAEETIEEKTKKVNELLEQITSEEKLAAIITELEGLLVEKDKEWKAKLECAEAENASLQEKGETLSAQNKELEKKLAETLEMHSKERVEHVSEIEELQVMLASTEVAAGEEKEKLEAMLEETKKEHSKEKAEIEAMLAKAKDEHYEDKTKLEAMLEEAHEKHSKQKARHETRTKELVAMLDEAHEAHIQQEKEHALRITELDAKVAIMLTREAQQVSTVQQLEMLLTEAHEEVEQAKISNNHSITALKEKPVSTEHRKMEQGPIDNDSAQIDDATSRVRVALGVIRRVLSNSISPKEIEEKGDMKQKKGNIALISCPATLDPIKVSPAKKGSEKVSPAEDESGDVIPAPAEKKGGEVGPTSAEKKSGEVGPNLADKESGEVASASDENNLSKQQPIEESKTFGLVSAEEETIETPRGGDAGNEERVRPPIEAGGSYDTGISVCGSAFCPSAPGLALFAPLEHSVPMLEEKPTNKKETTGSADDLETPLSFLSESNQTWVKRYVQTSA